MSTFFAGGNNRARTCDIYLVRVALSQLSYASTWDTVALYAHPRGKVKYFFDEFPSSRFQTSLHSTSFRRGYTVNTKQAPWRISKEPVHYKSDFFNKVCLFCATG